MTKSVWTKSKTGYKQNMLCPSGLDSYFIDHFCFSILKILISNIILMALLEIDWFHFSIRFTCSPCVHLRFSGFVPLPKTWWTATFKWSLGLNVSVCCVFLPSRISSIPFATLMMIKWFMKMNEWRLVDSWTLGPLIVCCIKSVNAWRILNIPWVDVFCEVF